MEVLDPLEGTQIFVGDALLLGATFSDPDGEEASLRLVWSSSLEGPLEGQETRGTGEGSLQVSTALRAGVHTLVALVVDEEGGVGTDTVEVTVIDPDRDGDGYWSSTWGGEDCRDDDPKVNPEAPDICDGLDQDCDGAVDEDATLHTLFPDGDLDGRGAPEPTWETCQIPEGWVLEGTDCDDTDATRGDCVSCKAIHGSRWDVGDGVYTIDPAGNEPFEVVCDQTRDGGGWTLVGTNGQDVEWDSLIALNDVPFGQPSLDDSFKSPAWSRVRFQDLRFENDEMDAVYQAVDLGDQTWQVFQGQIAFYNCGSPSFPMTSGTLQSSSLCTTDLFIHPKDQDGGGYGGCTPGIIERYGDDAFGPTWSVANNTGCPMDDPSASSFVRPGLPWGQELPLRMWVR